MASTYTTNTGIELITTGEQSGTWGDTTNVNLQIIDRVTNGVGSITLSGTTHTLTTTDGVLSDGQYAVLVFGGTPTGTNTVTISPNDQQKVFFAKNESGESVILSQGSGGDVTIANGNAAIVYADGGGAGAAVVDLTAVFPAEGALLAANNLSDVDNVATSRINLGLAIGTDVQAYDAELQSIANITPTDGVFLVGDGSTFVSETGDTVLTSIGVTATTAELNYVDGVTSPIQDQLDNISVTNATLTKTFSAGETSAISLSQAITAGAPVVSVTKEVPQTGLTSNTWDVATNGSNYDRHDTAYSTTLTPSNATGDGTFTLGAGSFASEDVGKTIEGNGGEAILTATDGSYSLVTSFNDTSAIASGDWSMYAAVFDATNGLELSGGVFGAGVGFDLASYGYYGVSFSVTSQDTTPYDVFLKPDGTKMYILGGQNTAVYQYSLSTPFDLNTASYDNVSFSVSSQTSFPFSFTFKADGTAFFLAERQNEDVFQYTLSTEWDLSTASYASKSYAQAQDTNLTGIAFNDDGTKMYLSGTSNSAVFQYSLSTAYDVSTASYDSVSLSLSAANDTPFGIGFNSDGSSLFVLDNDENIYQYNMTTAYDLSTASDAGISLSLSDTDSSSNFGFAFSNDGIKLYNVGGTSDSVYQYTTQSLVQPTSQYTPSVTNAGGQIDSTYWTDINSMTTDQVAGDGQVYYAVSTDGRTTWKVIDDANGVRPIVRDNAGTWQYNSNTTYGSATWTNATTNTELDALQQALSVTQNRMDKTQLEAVSDANHYTLDDSLDLMIALYLGSESASIPSSDGVSINYDASARNEGAVLGTDYDFDFPATDVVRVTSNATQNLKVRVV